MIEVDWNPDGKKLRQFGWICLGGFALAGCIAFFKFHSFTGAMIFWGMAIALPILGFISTKPVRLVYVVLTAVTLPIGFVVSHLALGLLYYGIFTPLAVFFRLKGRDELRRKLEPATESYWVECGAPRPAENYYRQF